MTRIERQLQLPKGFEYWSTAGKLSHFYSVRSRILRWHKHDVFQFKFGIIIFKLKWVWGSFTVAVFAGAAEFALGMLVEGMLAAFMFMLGMMAQEFYDGWRR